MHLNLKLKWLKSCNFVIIVWPWPVNWYQHEVLASCHSNMVHVYVVRLHVFLCFQVNQVLNLCNTINYVNFIVYFFLLAVMWHDSYLPFLFQPKIWCCKKKYTKMTKYLLGFILLFVEVFCYNNWGLYMANIFTSWQTIGKINLFLIQVFFFNMKTE